MLVAPVARTSRASSVFSGGMSPTTEPRGARAGDDDLLLVANIVDRLRRRRLRSRRRWLGVGARLAASAGVALAAPARQRRSRHEEGGAASSSERLVHDYLPLVRE